MLTPALSCHPMRSSEKRCKPYGWCPEPESNRYAGFILATDFKSVVSTNFTTRAGIWRREPESNRPTRICNPVHNRFAIAPCCGTHAKMIKGKRKSFPLDLEREKSLELSTSTLARLRSTN